MTWRGHSGLQERGVKSGKQTVVVERYRYGIKKPSVELIGSSAVSNSFPIEGFVIWGEEGEGTEEYTGENILAIMTKVHGQLNNLSFPSLHP